MTAGACGRRTSSIRCAGSWIRTWAREERRFCRMSKTSRPRTTTACASSSTYPTSISRCSSARTSSTSFRRTTPTSAPPTGPGPSRSSFFEAARSAIVERNSNYWESGLPHLDEVETFAISDDVARLNAVISGDIHCLQGLSPSLIDKVNSTDGIELLSTPSGYRVPAIMRTDRAPYDNPDVRLALKHLVDREEYNQIVYKGYSTIGNDHPVGQIYPEYCRRDPDSRIRPRQGKIPAQEGGRPGRDLRTAGLEHRNRRSRGRSGL